MLLAFDSPPSPMTFACTCSTHLLAVWVDRYSLMAGKRTNAAGITVEVPDSTPMHTEYLMYALENGSISQATLNSVA